jgi:hypothetical protein
MEKQMEIIAIILHLLNGEIAKIPVGLAVNQLTCETALLRVMDKHEDKNTFHYKGVEILGYYCKNNKGDWIP